MDDLRQLINELHQHPGPHTEEVSRTARSLYDGLRRLEALIEDHHARQQITPPQRTRQHWRIQATRRHVVQALRAVWQEDQATSR